MPVPTSNPRSSSFSHSNSKSCSLASSSSNSSIGNEIYRTEEANSFNSSILQRDVTPQCRIGASSSKTGHLVDNLRVQRPEDVSKLWQSDATGPHSITIELDRQTALSVRTIYLYWRFELIIFCLGIEILH